MKEPQLKTRFEAAVEELRGKDEVKTLLKHLGSLREAVRELQGEGMRLSLEVRPGVSGCSAPFDADTKVAANGTVTINNTAVNFVLLRSGASLRFKAYVGPECVNSVYVRPDEDLKQPAIETLVRIGAQVQMLEEFNLSESGVRGTATVKDFAVPAPLKLKIPQK